jgi:hypothetical protein
VQRHEQQCRMTSTEPAASPPARPTVAGNRLYRPCCYKRIRSPARPCVAYTCCAAGSCHRAAASFVGARSFSGMAWASQIMASSCTAPLGR